MIEQMLSKDRIICDMQSKTKNEALSELLRPLNLSADREKVILAALKKRESIGSTGIGQGIAIPHTRSVVLDNVILVIGRSKDGVEFDSLDGKPVHLFFLLIAPPNDPGTKYLITLGEIARMAKKIVDRGEEYLKIEGVDKFAEYLKGIAKEV